MASRTESDNLLLGYLLGLVLFVACIVVAIFGGENGWLQSMLCLLGAAGGWLAGIVATPHDEDEKSKLSAVAKGFLALGSGYVIAKLEDPLTTAVNDVLGREPGLLILRVCLFGTSLLIGFLFTLVTRLYGETEAEKRERSRVRLLAEAELLLERVAKLSNSLK